MVWKLSVKTVRSATGIGVGSAILLHETFLVPDADLNLLLTGLACLAGTFAWNRDEKNR